MATSNPICQRCGLEMGVAGIGWVVVYMAYDPPVPYEVRRADLCTCPQCGARVLTKFPDARPMGHFMGESFEDEIIGGLHTGKIAAVWERYTDQAKVPDLTTWLWDWVAKRRLEREDRTA